MATGAGLPAGAQDYTIETGPLVGREPETNATILLDTKTGKTWMLTVDNSNEPVWVPLPFTGPSALPPPDPE